MNRNLQETKNEIKQNTNLKIKLRYICDEISRTTWYLKLRYFGLGWVSLKSDLTIECDKSCLQGNCLGNVKEASGTLWCRFHVINKFCLATGDLNLNPCLIICPALS